MEAQKVVPFPYEYKEINAEEKAVIIKLFNATDIVRVGPKGYIVFKPYKKDAENIYNMPLRPSDVFVVSFPRSGTTWTQELVWLLANDLDYTTAAAVPIGKRYPFLEIFMLMDEDAENSQVNKSNVDKDNVDHNKLSDYKKFRANPATQLLASAPSPRFVKTHLPMSLLPPRILDTAKVVYVARDPRDVAVSCYHHARLVTLIGFSGTFKEFWNLFHRSLYMLTPYFEHVKEAWAKRHDPNMLFLFYEDLSKDLPAAIRRAADFLGKQFNDEQIAVLCDHLSFESFRNNKSVNYENLREFGLLAKNETFMRKGKVGGWRDYFDEEMAQQAERWIEENLRDTDLRFPLPALTV